MSGKEIRKEWERMGYSTKMFSDAQIEATSSFIENHITTTGRSYAASLDDLYALINSKIPNGNNAAKPAASTLSDLAGQMKTAFYTGKARIG